MKKQKTIQIPDEHTAQQLTPKEIQIQLDSGKLTKDQAVELIQKYMDSLEYTDEDHGDGYDTVCGGIQPEFLSDCGGIQPLPLLPQNDEEECECTEQS